MIPLREFLRTSFGKAVSLLGAFLFVWSLYGLAEGLRRLYFETFPVIHVTGSDALSPFSLPFSVQNQSTWLRMRDVKWSCRVIKFDTTVGISITGGEMADLSVPPIPATGTMNFRCPVSVGITSAMIKTLEIEARIKYRILFQDRTAKMTFNWISGRWIEGDVF